MLVLIQTHAPAEFAADDDQGVIDILNANSVTLQHGGRKQAGKVMAVLIANSIDPSTIIATILTGTNELLKSFLRVLEGQGVDFSTDGNQSVLSQYPDATVRDVLLSIGRTETSPAQEALSRDATLDDVTSARKELAFDLVSGTAVEAAGEEYRKAESIPQSIVDVAIAVLQGGV